MALLAFVSTALLLAQCCVSLKHDVLLQSSLPSDPDNAYEICYNFLVDNQPPWDSGVVTHDVLNETITYALIARKTIPIAGIVPWDLFLKYVVPYASIDEPRDNWRKFFYQSLVDIVPQSTDIKEVIFEVLNTAGQMFGFSFVSNTSPARMSPFETIAWGGASCTGQTLLQTAILRSIGWPARPTGTIWNAKPFDPLPMHYNNHMWTGVWDGQYWSFIDGFNKDQFNKSWINNNDKLCNQVSGSANYSVYAASWAPADEGRHYALPWNLQNDNIPAFDLTRDYQIYAGCPNMSLDQ